MRIPGAELPNVLRCGRIVALAAGLGLVLAACAAGPMSGNGAGVGADKPYAVNGVRYFPKADPNYDAVGVASWYGPGFHGRATASGQPYDMNAMTAAHTTLPFGTKVKVTNLETGHSTVLTINDRGPFVQDRIIDVSRKAAAQLGFHRDGVARVRVRVLNGYAGTKHVEAMHILHGPPDTDHFLPILARAMESDQRLGKFAWQNPESGRRGHIIPLTDAGSSQTTGCRNYRRTAAEGNRRTVYVGRACRESNGTWRIAREDRQDS